MTEIVLSLKKQIDSLTEKRENVVVAIEGRSCAGKSTLSEKLQEIYDCNIFHMDDFFLRPEQRTAERYAEPGGNIDYERFKEEILQPLKNRDNIILRKFSCSDMKLCSPEYITKSDITVIEGVYSMHPFFGEYYDFSVFFDISDELQQKRILNRNTPEKAHRYFNEWIPLEDDYFFTAKIRNRCKMIINAT